MANTDDLIGTLVQDAAPVRRVAHPFRLFLKWMGGAVAYIALSLVYSGLRPDLMLKLHSPLFLAELGLLACIVATALLSAALLAFPDVYQKRKLAFAPVLMLALFVLVIFLSWRADTPPAPPPVHSVQCLIFIASLSLPPAVWMFYSMRKFASTHHYLAGSIALLSAFSIGALSLRLSEQTDSIMHVIQWHYLPMIGVAFVGLWLGKMLLKW